jgi:hypothetical protein
MCAEFDVISQQKSIETHCPTHLSGAEGEFQVKTFRNRLRLHQSPFLKAGKTV